MAILRWTHLVCIPPHYLEDFHPANPKIRHHYAILAGCMLRETTGDKRSGFKILINQCPYDPRLCIVHTSQNSDSSYRTDHSGPTEILFASVPPTCLCLTRSLTIKLMVWTFWLWWKISALLKATLKSISPCRPLSRAPCAISFVLPGPPYRYKYFIVRVLTWYITLIAQLDQRFQDQYFQ